MMPDLEDVMNKAREYSRGMKCARCDQYTGNNHQGHYWAFCSVTSQIENFHFCCPGDCALHPAAPELPIGGTPE